jgi:hypothetical protein
LPLMYHNFFVIDTLSVALPALIKREAIPHHLYSFKEGMSQGDISHP